MLFGLKTQQGDLNTAMKQMNLGGYDPNLETPPAPAPFKSEATVQSQLIRVRKHLLINEE